ncbi:MAG: DUF4832 domain-containing protein, partial [Planctomycetota bacterium]
HDAAAETHTLPDFGGQARVEAEAFSATSPGFPIAESCAGCSGGGNIGYFWSGSWFEIEVESPRLQPFFLQMQASAPISNSQVVVERVESTGTTRLCTIPVSKTNSWWHYRSTLQRRIMLPKGRHTLRFRNLFDGVNIDYISFRAGTPMHLKIANPEANEGPDLNPLKGFNSGWWRPDDDYASVGFQYLEWNHFEPEDDAWDWNYVESVLDRAGSRNRHLIVQFVCDWDNWGMDEPVGDSHYRGPQWLLDRVPERRGPADVNDPGSRITRASDYDHPVFIEEAKEAITALSNYLNDDPRGFVLQVGVLGFWGEWHNYPRVDWSPSDDTKLEILGTYLSNLGDDGLTQIRYPDEPVAIPFPGMGYTNGSAVPSPHGSEFGDLIAAGELWKFGPVGGEWPPTFDEMNESNIMMWESFFNTGLGLDFLEIGRYSTMLPPEDKHIVQRLPDWSRSGRFMTMHRRMGYNFQVQEVRHASSFDESPSTHVEVDLTNTGIAPFYKSWEMQLAIVHHQTGAVIDTMPTDFDLRDLQPGETTMLAGTSDVPLDPNERYDVALRILQPGADDAKSTPWKLDPRHTYVVLANEVRVVPGMWNQDHALEGGWNMLCEVEP